MSKVTLDDVSNLNNPTSAVNTINNNSQKIETAFENTLSRDGSSPNQMDANLDMNSNKIVNLPRPTTVTEPVRVQDLESYSFPSIPSLPLNNPNFFGIMSGEALLLGRDGVGNEAARVSQVAPIVHTHSVSQITDYDVIPFTFAGASVPGSGIDMTTQWDAAVALANVTGKTLLIRGDGLYDRRWFRLQPGRQFPQRARTVVQGPVGIRGTVATGILFSQTGKTIVEGDLLIDGGNTTDTVTGGYVSGHMGMKIAHPVADTIITGVQLSGLKFQNFGEYGIETYYLDNPILYGVSHERIGVAGEAHWSSNGLVKIAGKIKNIFPGLPAGDWQRNAYGLTLSQFTGKRQSTGHVSFVTVEDVPTWTGLDTHSSIGVTFVNCVVTGCSQGIAAENHVPGVTMRNVSIQNNYVRGFNTGSTTKDGLTCYNVAGIVVNSSDAPHSRGVVIAGNTLLDCGERRPGVTGGGAAIAVRHSRNPVVSYNNIENAHQCGISLSGTVSSTDEILNASVVGNIIDGVTIHTSVRLGIAAYSHVQGFARNNIVNGLGSSSLSYNRPGTPVFSFNYGIVDTFSGASDTSNFWN